MTKNTTQENALTILRYVRENTYTIRWSYINYRPGFKTWTGKVVPVKDRLRKETVYDATDYPPEGWTFLGAGWSRLAFLGPDGKVYKVAKVANGWSGNTALGQSRSEAERYKQMCEAVQKAGARLAPCTLYYNSVLVMEHIPRPETLMDYAEIRALTNALKDAGVEGINDLHDTNVWRDSNGIPTIIDYAA